MKRLLFGLAIAAALASSVHAANLEDGVNALNRGEHAVAYKILRPLAEKGNAEAQFLVGHMYRTGQGPTKDLTEAVRWYRLGAEQENPDAEYLLGLMYSEGWGVPQDYVQAAEWFLRAAKQGDLTAQTALAILYADGLGVPKDHSKSQEWYRKAVIGNRVLAEQGDGSAMLSLYFAYLDGDGVLQDRETAYMWLTLAEWAGAKGADVFLKFHVPMLKFTAEEIEKGRNRANEWQKQHE